MKHDRTKGRLAAATGVAVAVMWLSVPALQAVEELSPTQREAAGETTGDNPAPDADHELEVLIVQALDQPTSLEVEDVPIRDTIDALSEATGIPIVFEPGTLGLLPYGSRTLVTASIEGQPLRDSLDALFMPIGLTYTPRDDRLLIHPTEPLRRICRRATWEELATLELLASREWSPDLMETLSFQFQDVPTGRAEAAREVLARLTAAVGAGSAAEVLEHACTQYGWTWYPSGEHVVVLSKTRQVERQLEKRVPVRYVQVSLEEALLDLAQQAGVLLRMDPGVMTTLPPQTAQRFSLRIENATVRQALEVVAGQTGLGYFIEPDGIRIASMIAPPSAGDPRTPVEDTARVIQEWRTNPLVGEIIFPRPDGSSFSFLLRLDDLTPEVDRLRKSRIEAEMNHIRRILEAEQPQD